MSKIIPPQDSGIVPFLGERSARRGTAPKERLLLTRSWQLLPYTLLGAVLFAWVSSAHLNQFFSVYLVLLAAQLGTVGIYSLMGWLRSKDRQNF
ncbi:hypothetical protein [Chamaesiphon polymorphus]|uniref:hypothetical protein n=1 Tax=Chamaesiphon polymorphus TaxID=2107691 RepID=UPI001C62D355|nr:hypothetical protein [Chamaesiphon polymorphus]